MAENEKQLGTQKLSLDELRTDVSDANKLLKTLGVGVNLDMSDVMKQEIKKQLDQLVNAVKRSGSQTKKTTHQISSDLQQVTRETATYGNKTANALTVVQKGYDSLGRTITETTKNGVLTKKSIVTQDEAGFIKQAATAVSGLSTAYKNLAAAKASGDITSQTHWQAEVDRQNAVLDGIKTENTARNHNAETIRTVNNLLQQQADLKLRAQVADQKLIEKNEVEIVKSATTALKDLKAAQINLETATAAGDSKGAQYWQDTINANNLILDQMSDQNFQATLSVETQNKINRILQERVTLQNKTDMKKQTTDEKDEAAYVQQVKKAVDDQATAYKNLAAAKNRNDAGGERYWQTEVDARKKIVNSLGEQSRQQHLSLKAQGEINNQLQRRDDLESQFTKDIEKSNTAFDKLMKSVGQMLVSMVAMKLLSNMWSSATEFAKEYHDALNEIRMVTGMTSEEAQSLGEDYIKLAKEMKVSSREIASAAVEYYRQGQTGDDVTENLEWTIKYAKVAGLEFNEAAEIMTAAMNSMELSAQKVTDVFSYLGDASAAGADEIGKAMQKASASAQEAGVSFEWLGAYIATVSEKTRQAPEVIGTAFNSMMARLHNIKATGFNEEDATRVNDIAKALASLPEPLALINSLTGEWVDMSDIFEGIASQWDTLSDKQRAYIATTMAGIRQQNIFLTLMNDMSKAGDGASRTYELYAGAIDSAGSASEKYSIYQESVTASLDGMKASWEELVNLFNGGDMFIGLYDSISKVLQAFTEGTQAMDGWNLKVVAAVAGVGLLVPVVYKLVAAIKTVSGTMKAMSMASAVSTIGLAVTALTALAGVIGTVSSGWKNMERSQQHVNYNKTIEDISDTVSKLESLKQEYVDLASKVGQTDVELERMKTIISEISGLAPSYSTSLTQAQGDVGESIKIVNAAQDEQINKLREAKALGSSQSLIDPSNVKKWEKSASAYQDLVWKIGTFHGLDSSGKVNTESIPDGYLYDLVDILTGDGAHKSAKRVQLGEMFNLVGIGTDSLDLHDGYISVEELKAIQTYINKVSSGALSNLLGSYYDNFNQQASEIVDLVIGEMSTSEDYINASDAQKEALQKSLHSTMMDQFVDRTYHDAQNVGNIESYISNLRYTLPGLFDSILQDASIESNAMENLLYSILTPDMTGVEMEHIESVVSEMVANMLEAGVNSDQQDKALSNMKSVFGDKFGEALWESLGFGAVSSVDAWQDPQKGIEHDMQRTLEREGFVSEGWVESLTDNLEEAGYVQEDIIKSYQKFLQFYQNGLVDDQFISDLLSAKDVAETYESKMGQLNGTLASLEEVNTALADVKNTWSEYIESASRGGEEYTDDLTKIQKEIQKVSQLQTDLRTVETGGAFSGLEGEELSEFVSSANNRLFAEFGTTDLTALKKFVGIASETQASGLAHLYEKSLTSGAQVLIDDLERYLGDAGLSVSDTLKESMLDAARIDPKGLAFASGGYVDTLMESLMSSSDGSMESMLEMASAIHAVTTAIQEGVISWDDLILAMSDGIDVSEMFQQAYRDTLPDPTQNQQKWQEYIDQLGAGDQTQQISAMKEIKAEAQSTAESIADLYRVTYGGDSEAYTRLYEKYGTTSLSMLETYVEAEKRALEEGAIMLSEAGHDVMGGYMVGGSFYGPNIMVEQMKDLVAQTTGRRDDQFVGDLIMDLTGQATSVEQLTAVLWLMNDALESGYLSVDKIKTAMSDGLTMPEAWNLLDEASMLEAIAKLKDFTSSIDDEEKLSFFETLFGSESFELNEEAYTSFLSVLSELEKESAGAGEDIRKNLELDEDVWKDIIDGGELAADSIKAIQKQTQKLKLKKLEDAGEVMEGTAEAFELAEKGGSEYQDKVIELYKEMSDLTKAQSAYNFLTSGATKETEGYSEAMSDLASYVGIDASLLENNMSLALSKLTADANMAQATIVNLAQALFAVAGSSFNPSGWTGGLITLGDGASETAQRIAELINTMLQVRGAQIAATLNADGTAATIDVKMPGASSFKPSGGGSKGGGGGGNKKNDSTSEATKLLDRMADAIDKIAKKMEALDSIMSRFDTEGYITGMINALELENELIEEQIELQKENQKVIDEKLATMYVDLSKKKKGSSAYESLLEEIEALEDAYNEYTVAILENEAALAANKKEMKEHRESIRDMEIDLREEILAAIEDRIEREEDALDARLDMEDQILDAIIRRHEKERDQILETTEMQIDALEQEKDALDEALNARKEAAEEEDRRLELAELEAQYQRIASDPTRAKEALKIQKQIKELRDDIAWDKAEKEVEDQKEALDQQITSLEDYAEYVEKYYDDLLENPRNFLNEVNSILNMSHEQILAWLRENSEEYMNSTDTARKDFENGWRDTLNTMNGITITHWDEVESIIQQGDEAIIEFLKNNSQDYREAGKLQAEAYVDAWREKLELLKKAYENIVPELPAQKETPESSQAGSGTASSGTTRTYYGGYDADGVWQSGYGATKSDAIYFANKKGILNPKFSTSPISKPSSSTGGISSAGVSGMTGGSVNSQFSQTSFATGGMADFTGPAWLDGSPSAPERVLSPHQTKLFETLVASLQKATTITIPSLPAIASPEKGAQGSYSFGDIVVNVDKLENDADYEEMARRVGEVILKQMNRGTYVGGIRYSF